MVSAICFALGCCCCWGFVAPTLLLLLLGFMVLVACRGRTGTPEFTMGTVAPSGRGFVLVTVVAEGSRRSCCCCGRGAVAGGATLVPFGPPPVLMTSGCVSGVWGLLDLTDTGCDSLDAPITPSGRWVDMTAAGAAAAGCEAPLRASGASDLGRIFLGGVEVLRSLVPF